jgi:hypothetical protein
LLLLSVSKCQKVVGGFYVWGSHNITHGPPARPPSTLNRINVYSTSFTHKSFPNFCPHQAPFSANLGTFKQSSLISDPNNALWIMHRNGYPDFNLVIPNRSFQPNNTEPVGLGLISGLLVSAVSECSLQLNDAERPPPLQQRSGFAVSHLVFSESFILDERRLKCMSFPLKVRVSSVLPFCL